MSAFLALATYNKRTKSFLLTYKPDPLLRYRGGQKVIVIERPPPLNASSPVNNPLEPLAEESIPISQRHRFRRVPEELLDLDPREYYSRELFMYPPPQSVSETYSNQHTLGQQSGWLPGNLRMGDEVEIQWRMRSSYGYGW